MIDTVERDAETLKKDIGKFREDLDRTLADIGHYSHEKVVETRDKLRKAAEDFGNVTQERLSRAREVMREQGEKAVTASREAVRKKPFTAIVVAFIAGLLSAVLMERRAK
jgi:ElaB/YqjD/DUF883 family membrane-anchored ribosome-binding protein